MGHWKLIPCRLDYARTEKILKQLEGAVEHIANSTLPEFHQDPQACLKCWAFKRVCTPPFASGEGMQVFSDPEFAAKIARRVELADSASEYDRYDRGYQGIFEAGHEAESDFHHWRLPGEGRGEGAEHEGAAGQTGNHAKIPELRV
jgi:hypothetical protein